MTEALARLAAALSDRYRVERELGQGGMATVYLAHDIRHERDVAIKVLHPDLGAALGGDRFLSEIRTTARLQHPHILPLLDSGEAHALLYYVMPLVTGETLRTRLERARQLPIDDAVRIAREVASALDYAHRQGVIHRDIKPENILLHDGQALVADFGIALAVQTAGGARMTQTGLSLGTPQYMSPEQAMGEKQIDARSDIYALGAVTYEMLAGDAPFTGGSVQAIVAKIMTEKPTPVHTLRDTVPDHVEEAVLTALAKLPADRFATAAEFAAALAGTGTTRARVARRIPDASIRRGRGLAVAIGAVAMIAGVMIGRSIPSRPPAVVPPMVRYAMPLPDTAAFIEGGGSDINFAPDGSKFAYVSRYGIMLRSVDQLESVRIVRGTVPFFSPDGLWLGYADGGRILKLSLAGGTPVQICDSCTGYAFHWGSDDTVRFHRAPAEDVRNSRVLMAVSARGGRAYEVARPDSSSGEAFRSPILLPGTRTVLFALFTGNSSRLAALDLASGKVTRFDQPGFTPRWVELGFVTVGSADGALVAVPFDKRRARPTGPPVTIARDVSQPDGFSSRAAVSLSGSIVYAQGGGALPRELFRVSRSGQATRIPTAAKLFSNPRVAPDGRRIVVGITDAGSSSRDVWVLDMIQGTASRLTTNGISNRPIWTTDGQRVVYSSNDDLWWIAGDGSGTPDSLLVTNGSRFGGTVTSDGRELVFHEEGSEREGIRRLRFDSAPVSTSILTGRFGESSPALSPDGRWLAYQSHETGRTEVYVRPYPAAGARVSISLGGGAEPAWSRTGRELFYRTGDSLMVATVETSAALAVVDRRLLFRGEYVAGAGFREYDVTPDDRHFIMLGGGAGRSTLIGMQHVFESLLHGRQVSPK
jgi:serine/threonine-protein kinase